MIPLLVQPISNEESTNILPVPWIRFLRCRFHGIDRLAFDRGVETSASLEIAKHTLLSCGLVLAVGTLAGLLAQKIRIPDVAVFLTAGIAIGPQALGLIDIKAGSALNQIILLFGASYILFDGGASLRLDVLKQVWITILTIATVGVLITAGITGLAAHYILGVPASIARCCWARRWPRPIRQRWCRSFGRSTFATGLRKPSWASRLSTTPRRRSSPSAGSPLRPETASFPRWRRCQRW